MKPILGLANSLPNIPKAIPKAKLMINGLNVILFPNFNIINIPFNLTWNDVNQ